MIKCRGIPFRDEDDAYHYFKQRDIDEAVDVQLALFAGKNATHGAANPYPAATPEHDAWERGRSSVQQVAA